MNLINSNAIIDAAFAPQQFAPEMVPEFAVAETHRFQNLRKVMACGAVIIAAAGASLSIFGRDSGNSLHNEAAITTTSTSELDTKNAILTAAYTEGLTSDGQETPEAVPNAGSCAPYSRAEVQRRINEQDFPLLNLRNAEIAMLQQHSDVANEMAKTAESRNGILYDLLHLDRPSKDESNAGNALIALVQNDGFKSGTLVNAEEVDNTLCTPAGEVKEYRDVTLQAGTGVFGVQVDEVITTNGQRSVKLNGEIRQLKPNAKVAQVKLADGTIVTMILGNKAGVDVDNDGNPDLGCFNILSAPNKKAQVVVKLHPLKQVKPTTTTNVPTTVTTVGTTSTTLPSTTSTTGGSTTTTGVTTSTTTPSTTTTSMPSTTTTTGSTTTTTGSTTTTTGSTSTTVPNTSTTLEAKTPGTNPPGETTTIVTIDNKEPRSTTTSITTPNTTASTRPVVTLVPTSVPQTGRTSTTLNQDSPKKG